MIRSVLRLIRLPNLLIIVAAQFLVRYCLILPAYKISFNYTEVFPDHLSRLQFLLLLFSTLFIAIGGYIMNDYYDVETDRHNKPGKNVVGKLITEKTAYILSLAFYLIGCLIGFYISFQINHPKMGMAQVFSAVSLYMYSAYYQKRVLSGNFLIAFLSALSLLIVGLYEPDFYPNFIYLIWFAAFSFSVTLLRELIKDIEDLDGDEKAQYKTFPIRFGVKKAKQLGLVLVAFNLLLLFGILYSGFYENAVINFWFLLSIFGIPFLALGYMISNAEEKKDFTYASLFAKFIMVGGIFSIVGFWYYFLR